jgi:hypothetical protein
VDHPVSLWRKRNNVHHNEQKPDHLVNILPNLSIKSEDLSMQSNMIWVDPPEGWKYGFPAIYDPEKDGQMSEWIVRKGYPLLTIKEYGESWAVRCWPVEVKPSDES